MTTLTPAHSEKRDFGLVDEKGRAVGGRLTVYDYGDGEFRAYPQALRDGEKFGAIPNTAGLTFPTMRAAIDYGQGRLDAMARRYAKKYAITAA